MATKPLRIIFAGTPDFAASSLNALLTSEHEVIAVYTQPDRPAGRGRKLTPSPVKQVAIEHNIPVYQPLNFKAVEDQEQLATLDADIMVVVAYGLLLPKVILETPRLGCINVHASLLPRWRGAAPIHRALLAGDTATGVTIMQMDIGLDTGDMLLKTHCPIQPTDTSGELHDRLALQGAEALIEGLAKISADDIQPEVQDDALACYASKLEKQEGQINWTQSATDIDRQIRGLAPWPVAFTQLDDKVLRIWRASADMSRSGEAGSIIHADKKGIVVACGQGSIVLTEIQLPGKKSMDAASILNSRRELFSVGTQLG